jgi:hypothetical protein
MRDPRLALSPAAEQAIISRPSSDRVKPKQQPRGFVV